MLLRELAHSRAGDKGSFVTLSVIARHPGDYPLLEDRITAERVTAFFSELVCRPAERYTIPHLGALNFVLHRPETLAVTRSLSLDAHGKCLSSALLAMEIGPRCRSDIGS